MNGACVVYIEIHCKVCALLHRTSSECFITTILTTILYQQGSSILSHSCICR